MPAALAAFRALTEVEGNRAPTDIVDAELVAIFADMEPTLIAQALAWGELVGAVSRGAHGLVLNPLVKLALSRFVAPAPT